MKFYTVRQARYAQPANWLYEDDVDNTLYAVEELLDRSREFGRLDAPEVNTIRYRAETSASTRGARPQPYERLGGGDLLVETPFVEVFESLNVSFRAVPMEAKWRKKRWDNYWRLRVEKVIRLPLISGDEVVFRDKDTGSTVYYSERAKEAVDSLGWWIIEWVEHELEVCQAKPMETFEKVEEQVLSSLADLFRDKAPRAKPGSRYGADYFVDRLLETYSDIDRQTLLGMITDNPASPFVASEDEWIAVREDSELGREL